MSEAKVIDHVVKNDEYASRGREKAQLKPRNDPVVYADERNHDLASNYIEQYKNSGFLILDNVFTEREIELFQRELHNLRNSYSIKNSEYAITEPGSGEVRSIFQMHAISEVFKSMVCDNRLAGLAGYLLNDNVYIHQSRLNYKPGFRGKEFYWHSDFETWHIEDGMPRMRALSMSIALTENYEHNGPLMLIPGSHNFYAVCEGDTPSEHFKESLKKQEYGVPSDESLQKMVEQGGIVTATCKPGSVIVFDCNTMHGSNGNITPYPRSNAFIVYNAISNKVVEPFCDQPPRPEYICTRDKIKVIRAQLNKL